MRLESIQHLVEPGRQQVTSLFLLVGFRKRLVQPINRVNQPMDAPLNELLNIVFVLDRRVFTQ